MLSSYYLIFSKMSSTPNNLDLLNMGSTPIAAKDNKEETSCSSVGLGGAYHYLFLEKSKACLLYSLFIYHNCSIEAKIIWAHRCSHHKCVCIIFNYDRSILT